MRNDLLDLETDFANNEYFGTNVWTEEKYRVISGGNKVLLSAPHSVNQIRGDDVRDAEKYTGALVRYLCNSTSSYGIFEIFTHADPNNDIENDYKNAVINLINTYNIKLLIDVHSSKFKDDTDIDIVTNKRETLVGKNELFDKLKNLGVRYNLKIDENNVPNKDMENEIISVSSLLCGIPSIRVVINEEKLDVISNEEKATKIVNLLEEFISYFNYS